MRLCDQLGFPLVIRPSFTLGGTGGSIAYNKEEFGEAIAHALDMSPVHEALVEESVLGWKEYELEVMRDHRDNFVVICTIENFDPMGVHTGDSITVAPAQTLTDKVSTFVNLFHAAENSVATRGADPDVKAFFDSLQVERHGARSVLTAAIPPGFLRKVVGASQVEGTTTEGGAPPSSNAPSMRTDQVPAGQKSPN